MSLPLLFTVRRARPADAARLTTIARAAKARWGYPPQWLAAWEPQLALPPEYIAEHHVFAAERPDGTLIGVTALVAQNDHWLLEHVWVDPVCEGQGVGRALVRAALAAARKLTPQARVVLHADPHASGFYERLGGRRVGSVPAPMNGSPDRALPVYVFEAERAGRA